MYLRHIVKLILTRLAVNVRWLLVLGVSLLSNNVQDNYSCLVCHEKANRIRGHVLRRKCFEKQNKGSLVCNSQLCTDACMIWGQILHCANVGFCVIYPFTTFEVVQAE